LRDEAARVRERVAGKPRSLADARKLGRRASRLPSAAAADIDAELVLERREPPFQRTDDARRDARRVPVHPHHGAERLEPERMREPAKQLVAAVVMDDRLGDHASERGHAGGEPCRNPAAVQRKVRAACTFGHRRSIDDAWGQSSRAAHRCPYRETIFASARLALQQRTGLPIEDVTEERLRFLQAAGRKPPRENETPAWRRYKIRTTRPTGGPPCRSEGFRRRSSSPSSRRRSHLRPRRRPVPTLRRSPRTRYPSRSRNEGSPSRSATMCGCRVRSGSCRRSRT